MNTYQVVEAKTGQYLEGDLKITQVEELDEIMRKSQNAFEEYAKVSATDKANFLDTIADEILHLGDELLNRASQETALPIARLTGERGRTMNQLKLFADLLRKGEWRNASIDTAQPEREPMPKLDLRKILSPVGPVIVFGSSNFPLAYSTAGGDTASALAAGCSVIVKAHAAHGGTSEMVAKAISIAIEKCKMPKAIFQHVHDTGFKIGSALVAHPETCSVGFTGSLTGGRALLDIAAKREKPIPVFAEMGSTNPVLLFPNVLEKNGSEWAKTYAGSITLGVGQFCTNPGLIFGIKSRALDQFIEELKNEISTIDGQEMLHSGIHKNFTQGRKKLSQTTGVELKNSVDKELKVRGSIATVSGEDFMNNPNLHEEVFGPFSLVVECSNSEEMLKIIGTLSGQLTGTVIASDSDLEKYSEHIDKLISRVGRVLFNGVPTGVEVCPSMNHGGPYPATTDERFTAVGPDAILRFVRPVTYQNWPDKLLPIELQNSNPLNISRRVDGEMTNKEI